MKKEGCIFCKIANGEIPTYTIYEDEMFRGILDVSPATKGHTLILPKEHCTDLFDLSKEQSLHIMEVVQKVGKKLKETFDCAGINVIQNNGEVAGQTVFHYHLHLIPRYEGDGQKISWNITDITKEELEIIHQSIVIQ